MRKPIPKPHREPDADDYGGKPDGDKDDKANARRKLVKGGRK